MEKSTFVLHVSCMCSLKIIVLNVGPPFQYKSATKKEIADNYYKIKKNIFVSHKLIQFFQTYLTF